jgi:hypothetical protein
MPARLRIKLSVDDFFRQNAAVSLDDMDCDVRMLRNDAADRRRKGRARHRGHQSGIHIPRNTRESFYDVLSRRQCAQHLNATLVIRVRGQRRNDCALVASEKANAEGLLKLPDVLRHARLRGMLP